jgi:DNA-directed RNA polymerase subunit RPC12/RpoP
VFFSFGPRRPAEIVATQRLLADMGLAVRSLTPGFNSYVGAGILAGTSHLYHLRTTQDSRPSVTGRFDGPLYTAQTRAAVTRPYQCAACGALHEVGPGARWASVGELKAAGCPACGGTVLRPRPLGAGPGQGPRDGAAPAGRP